VREDRGRDRNAHLVIAFAADLLIVACRIQAAQSGTTIEAPELVRLPNQANDFNDVGKSQEARTERLELGSLRRLEKYVSNELMDTTNICDLPR